MKKEAIEYSEYKGSIQFGKVNISCRTKNILEIEVEDCLKTIHHSSGMLHLCLNHLQNCGFRVKKHLEPESKDMDKLLRLTERLGLIFGCSRIFVQTSLGDDAKYKETDILLTILTAMKDGVTYYEKRGFNMCDSQAFHKDYDVFPVKDMNISQYIELLRELEVSLFYYMLSPEDKELLELDLKKEDFRYIHELYNYYITNYFINKESVFLNKVIQLQTILCNPKYMWFPIVDVIINKVQCMEKIIRFT